MSEWLLTSPWLICVTQSCWLKGCEHGLVLFLTFKVSAIWIFISIRAVLTLQKGSCITESQLWDLGLWLHPSWETPFAWPGISLELGCTYHFGWTAHRGCHWSRGLYQFTFMAEHALQHLKLLSSNASSQTWAQWSSAIRWRSLTGKSTLVVSLILLIYLHACVLTLHSHIHMHSPSLSHLLAWLAKWATSR